MHERTVSEIRRRAQKDGAAAHLMLMDKCPLYRDGLRACLTKAGGFSVCGEAVDATKAKRIATALQPDVAIIGIEVPDLALFDFIDELCQLPKGPKVVVLLADEGVPGQTASLFRRGASAVLSRHVDGDELVEAVRNVLDGRAYLSAETIEQLVRRRNRTAGGVG